MERRRNCSTEAISPFFHNIFNIYISNERSQITCSFVKIGCSLGIFLNSANLICRSTDISKCFRGSLRLRDNESPLYIKYCDRAKLKCIVEMVQVVKINPADVDFFSNIMQS